MAHVGFLLNCDANEKDKLLKATRDSNKTTIEIVHGLMAQTIKDRLFNHVTHACIKARCEETENGSEESP